MYYVKHTKCVYDLNCIIANAFKEDVTVNKAIPAHLSNLSLTIRNASVITYNFIFRESARVVLAIH